MAIPIPESWKKDVCRILQSGNRSLIDLKIRAQDEWNAATNHAFFFELWNDLEDALNDPTVLGKKHVMEEPGETYAFFFIHYLDSERKKQQQMYSKICLCPDNSIIIIYSAHKPKWEKL